MADSNGEFPSRCMGRPSCARRTARLPTGQSITTDLLRGAQPWRPISRNGLNSKRRSGMTKPNTDLHLEQNGRKDFALRARLNQQKLTSNLKSHYDFIVCGAGTSGCVVAAKLAADSKSEWKSDWLLNGQGSRGRFRHQCFHVVSWTPSGLGLLCIRIGQSSMELHSRSGSLPPPC